MINWISSWAEQIIVAVVIGTIIEMILSDGNNKKYVKTVIGVYILFTIVSPIIGKVSGKDLQNFKIDYDEYLEESTYEALSKDLTNSNDNNVEIIYISNLKQDMTNKIKEKGYKVISINIEAELKDENNYGKVNKINLKLTKYNEVEKDEQGNKISINKIQINNTINNSVEQEKESEELKKDEINMLKTYLSNVYDLSEKYIHINE